MQQVTSTKLGERLTEVMDQVCDSRAPLLVTRQNGRSVVLISAEEWENINETMYLMSNPRNASRLLESIGQLDAGSTVEHPPKP